jgi:hypothetical protein
MPSITILNGALVNAVPTSIGDVVTDLTFAEACSLVASGAARWTGATTAKPLPNVAEREVVLDDVTALTGAAPAGLAGYLVAGIPVGRVFVIKLTAEVQSRRYRVITKAGETADADNIFEPPDFDATGNNKYLLRIQ